MPTLRFVPLYPDHPAYIDAVRARIIEAQSSGESADHIVVSFHGLPERYVNEGDPYQQQCTRTVTALVAVMKWRAGDFTVSFQSRFGRERWLGPATSDVLKELPAKGVKRPGPSRPVAL